MTTTTLEEVFLKVGEDDTVRPDLGLLDTSDGKTNVLGFGTKHDPGAAHNERGGVPLGCLQVAALVRKRFQVSRRDLKTALMLLFPMGCILAGFMLVSEGTYLSKSAKKSTPFGDYGAPCGDTSKVFPCADSCADCRDAQVSTCAATCSKKIWEDDIFWRCANYSALMRFAYAPNASEVAGGSSYSYSYSYDDEFCASDCADCATWHAGGCGLDCDETGAYYMNEFICDDDDDGGDGDDGQTGYADDGEYSFSYDGEDWGLLYEGLYHKVGGIPTQAQMHRIAARGGYHAQLFRDDEDFVNGPYSWGWLSKKFGCPDAPWTDLVTCMIILGGFLLMPGLLAEPIVEERARRLRNLLTVTGTEFRAYWVGTFAGDFSLLMFICFFMWIVLAALPEDDFGRWTRDGRIYYVMPAFLVQLTAFSYLLSHFFPTGAICMAGMPILFLSLLVAPVALMTLGILSLGPTGAGMWKPCNSEGQECYKTTEQIGHIMWMWAFFSPHGNLLVSLVQITWKARAVPARPRASAPSATVRGP